MKTVAPDLAQTRPELVDGAPAQDDPEAQRMLASLRLRLAGADTNFKVGRFWVLEPLGSGGMGTVYAAYDPQLDRRVAVKLVRGVDGDGGTERLMREAKALAKLSDPNVVAVHDVGVFEDHVYIAMELVEGVALDRWLREQDRPWREVVELFIQAGRGLARAHEAGLVHRDFKPANVVVGSDGRVRVLDFGLAREFEDGDPTEEIEAAPSRVSDNEATPSASMTQSGVVLGTPAYMSVEQALGQRADPRSDQFSFCISLYEAVYGCRPFPVQPPVEFVRAARDGRFTAPVDRSAPDWIGAIVRRGLSYDPGERFASMHALIDALARGLSRQRRLKTSVGAATLVVAGALTGTMASGGESACAQVSDKIDAIWSSHQKSVSQAALRETGLAHADDTWSGVERGLDAYVDAWIAERRDACEATNIRGEQSPELLDRRMACLDEGLVEVRAIVGELGRADAAVVDKAVGAVDRLPDVSQCAAEHVMHGPEPVRSPQAQAVRDTLGEARVLSTFARQAEALVLVTPLLTRAEHIGDAELEAQVSFRVARLQALLGEHADAEAMLGRTIARAAAAGAVDLLARAWVERVNVMHSLGTRAEQALELSSAAEAVLVATNASPEVRSRLANKQASVLQSLGRLPEAENHAHLALRLAETAYGTGSHRLSNALVELGHLAYLRGHYDESLTHYERALGLLQDQLGSAHPLVGLLFDHIGVVMQADGRCDEAVEYGRRAATIYGGRPDRRGQYAAVSFNLGTALACQGHKAEARDVYEESLEVLVEVRGPRHANVGTALVLLASSYLDLEQPERALQLFQRAHAVHLENYPKVHHRVADVARGLAQAQIALGNLPAARAHLERALDLYAQTIGTENQHVEQTLALLGSTLDQLGDDGREFTGRAAHMREIRLRDSAARDRSR